MFALGGRNEAQNLEVKTAFPGSESAVGSFPHEKLPGPFGFFSRKAPIFGPGSSRGYQRPPVKRKGEVGG